MAEFFPTDGVGKTIVSHCKSDKVALSGKARTATVDIFPETHRATPRDRFDKPDARLRLYSKVCLNLAVSGRWKNHTGQFTHVIAELQKIGLTAAMRYFFHILQGGSRVQDTDGVALPSDEQARREAARSLTDYLSELSFSSDYPQQVAIQVEREDGGFATLVSCQVDFLKAC